MPDSDMTQPLQSLHTTRSSDRRIQVRVTRMWASIYDDGQNFPGMNLIVLDDQNYHVHAFVEPHLWNNFEDLILEGNMYYLEDFAITQVTRFLRPVSSNFSIRFTEFTIAEHILGDLNLFIPLHKFELLQLEQVNNLANSILPHHPPTYSIDVAGVVEDLEPVRTVQTHLGQKRYARFKLYDGRHRVNVLMCDEQTESLEPLFQGNFHIFPIIILASTRPFLFRGDILLMSLESSKIYMNTHDDIVFTITQRLIGEGYEVHL